MHPNGVIPYTLDDNATFLEVEAQSGMVPVAIASSAATWTPASFTLQLPYADSGMSGETETFKETDDSAVNLADDKWTTIPEAMGRKCAAVQRFRILLNAAETGGPVTVYIAWAPLGGA